MIYIIEHLVDGQWQRYCRRFVQAKWYDEPGICPVMFSRRKDAETYLATRGDGFRIKKIVN